MGLEMPVVTLELPAYSKKENWGAAETFYQLVRSLLKSQVPEQASHNPLAWKQEGRRPRVMILPNNGQTKEVEAGARGLGSRGERRHFL